jgi:hypothetical protein
VCGQDGERAVRGREEEKEIGGSGQVELFLPQSIRKIKPDADPVTIPDNFRSPHADTTREYAEQKGIDRVFFTAAFSGFEPPLSSSGKA